MFLHNQELEHNSWQLEEALSGLYVSNSLSGAASSPPPKNIVSERNRRKRLNQRLCALRSVVPKISKLDKASIIKDSIDYIQELQEQERRLQAEIRELETGISKKNLGGYDDDDHDVYQFRSKKIKRTNYNDCFGSKVHSPIEVLELNVTCMGEKRVVVSITCSKKIDNMVKLCEVFASLNLKIITVNITFFSDRLLNTVFLEGDDYVEEDLLKVKIETAVSAFHDIVQRPMSLS